MSAHIGVRTAAHLAAQLLNTKPGKRYVVPALDDGPFTRWAVFETDEGYLRAFRVAANDSWRGPLIRQGGKDIPVLSVTGFLGTAIAPTSNEAISLVEAVAFGGPGRRS